MEDTGYMARIAFIMDKPLRRIGLSGRAFVPMLMGFGCSVPAVMGTRILENPKDRKLTIFMIPFMSCSAKMTIYAFFVPIFFNENQALIIFSLYIIGILISVFSAIIIKKFIIKKSSSNFILELPPYRLPTLRNLTAHVWKNIKDFLIKAGTVLLFCSVLIWFLENFNFNFKMVKNSSESIVAETAGLIAPIFAPCGFNNWKIVVSLISGLVAKESVISTMAVLYKNERFLNLSSAISNVFTPLSAYSFLIFVLLYTPCIAALSAIKKEFKSFKWTALSIVYQIFTAWFFSMLFFQISNFLLDLSANSA